MITSIHGISSQARRGAGAIFSKLRAVSGKILAGFLAGSSVGFLLPRIFGHTGSRRLASLRFLADNSQVESFHGMIPTDDLR